MAKIALVFFLLIVLSVSGGAQEVQMNVDPAVEQLVRTWVARNKTNPHIEGWRIQILSSTDRQQVEMGRNQFLSLFPDVPAGWVHEKPYYKLRVGAFRTRQEALSFLAELKDNYPGAYPAKDPNIHPRDFLN